MLRALLALAIALLVLTPARATTFGLHLGTWHERDTYQLKREPAQRYQSINPGAYVRFDSGLTLGGYRNSFDRTSLYVGWTWERRLLGALDGGASVVAITGYPAADIAPAIALSARMPLFQGSSVRVTAPLRLSKAQKTNSLHLSVEWEF